MKRLNEYIKESLLDDEDELMDKHTPEKLIIDFIKRMYDDVRENQLVVRKEKSGYIVDCKGDVRISDRRIKSLTDGLFKWGVVKGNFTCARCSSLISLEGCPEEVGRNFDCSYCKNLVSLEGAPKFVGESFDCSWCAKIKTLEGCPNEVGWNFKCSICDSLISLKGCPKRIPQDFLMEYCKSLTSLEFFPKRIGRRVYCSWCGKEFTLAEVQKYCDIDKLSR